MYFRIQKCIYSKKVASDWIIHTIPISWLITYIGAICGHMLSVYSNDFVGIKPFVEKILPNKSQTFYNRIDFLVLPLIGSFLAYILLDPTNLKSSIFAGLSWSGSLTAILKRGNIQASNDEKL